MVGVESEMASFGECEGSWCGWEVIRESGARPHGDRMKGSNAPF